MITFFTFFFFFSYVLPAFGSSELAFVGVSADAGAGRQAGRYLMCMLPLSDPAHHMISNAVKGGLRRRYLSGLVCPLV